MRKATKLPEPQEVSIQPLAINYDRFKEDEISDLTVRVKLNSAWRALDGLRAIGRVLEANQVEQTSQDEPLVLEARVVTGLLSAVIALAEIGQDEVDGCGEHLHRKEREPANNGRLCDAH